MISKVLIANRGDIAIRILRACKEMDIKTVAVHSVVDANLMHVRFADESVCIGPNRAADSYLNISAILSAAELTGADAIHPGVGFLSENEKFAKIVIDHGLKFIGPEPKHIAMMGDKIMAKKTMASLGVPVVEGSEKDVGSYEEALQIACKVGYPILFKAVAGGGGKGMKLAYVPSEVKSALEMAKSEAKSNFGNGSVYIERYLANPKHIEIQIIADGHGNVIHLFERDCSIQRNHQKLMEESPSVVLSSQERARIGEVACKAVKELGYIGVGTLEFLYERGEFFFMEMNTRLQVEHPVSEAVTGLDIVKEQIRIASNKKLSIPQKDVKLNGHAIEFRINAEHPKTFVPSPGEITAIHFPGGNGVRVDSHVYKGYEIPPYYDSLIAKIIIHAATREECLRKAAMALEELAIDGVFTTSDLHKKLVVNKDVRSGNFDIQWLANNLENL
jgi:acetyl-CoA carboxylase biotin carboxylase subunit